jgi:hypothetical protein
VWMAVRQVVKHERNRRARERQRRRNAWQASVGGSSAWMVVAARGWWSAGGCLEGRVTSAASPSSLHSDGSELRRQGDQCMR